MTRKELDTLWQQALHESVVAGEDFIRYHFAALVANAEREACARVCERFLLRTDGETYSPRHMTEGCAAAIRARGET